jgi:hypothetical protein
MALFLVLATPLMHKFWRGSDANVAQDANAYVLEKYFDARVHC